MESPGADVYHECDATIFAWVLCSTEPPFCALVAYHLEKDGMPLHDEVGVNDIKAQVPGLRGECWIIIHV